MTGILFIAFALMILDKKEYLKILKFLKSPDIPLLIFVVLPIAAALIGNILSLIL